MKKLTFLAIIVFYTANAFAQSNINKNYTFYSDGGDTLQFSIKNKKLHLIDTIVLNYQPAKKLFYLIEKEVQEKNFYGIWAFITEYMIVPTYKSNLLESISLTVRTTINNNKLINTYTKKFNRVNKNKGKFFMEYKLVKTHSDLKKYCGNGFDKKQLKTMVTNYGANIVIDSSDSFGYLLNNDGTLTINPGYWSSHYITAIGNNKFSGPSTLWRSHGQRNYTHIEKINQNTINIFDYSSGEGADYIFCGEYKLVDQKKVNPILFNRILAGEYIASEGYEGHNHYYGY